MPRIAGISEGGQRKNERRDFFEYLSNSDYQAAGKALSRRQLGISDSDNDSDVSHFFTSLMIDALRPLWECSPVTLISLLLSASKGSGTWL